MNVHRSHPRRSACALVCSLVLGGFIPNISSALTLDEALRIAEAQAPSLNAQTADVELARSMAKPADQLPDPKLLLGLNNFPISGDNRGELNAEPMTMQMVGISQEVTSSDKRQARVAMAQATIETAQAQRQIERLNVRLQTALAWISARATEQKLQLFKQLYSENKLFAAAIRASIAGGQGQSADSVAPRQEALLLAEQQDSLEQERSQQRAALRRWIGEDARQPLTGKLPQWQPAPAQFSHALEQHPELAVYEPMSRQADAAISAAVAEKQPDWAWQVAYQKRGADFGDMVSVQFSVDLPVFAGSRQDPKIAASHSARNRLDAQREAKLRQHRQQLDDLLAQYHRLDRAVERSQSQLIPLAVDKVQLSLADYRAGKNQLANLISARRELIEARLRDIDLQQQRSLVSANLHYAYTEISQ
ncbi:MAG: hypothetical protein CMK71_06280 [Pseudomonadaceae bacterium]|nr:hypothetical protein [Pseudomonadaceae bacterium]